MKIMVVLNSEDLGDWGASVGHYGGYSKRETSTEELLALMARTLTEQEREIAKLKRVINVSEAEA